MPTNQLRPTATAAPSAQITQPRCKVCQHPQRLDIEVALVEGRSRQLVAERFSTSELPLNCQNLHVHNQKHMDTVDRAVVDKARARTRNALLDVHTGRGIQDQEDELLSLLHAHARAAIVDGRVRVTLRDILLLNAERARIEHERDTVHTELVMIQSRTFGLAVRNVVQDDDTHRQILAEYDRLGAERDSNRSDQPDIVTEREPPDQADDADRTESE